MKTAMQELIEHLHIEMKQKGIIPNWDMYLEKEKEQIKDAYHKGGYLLIKKPYGEFVEEVEQYYNQTYNKKEE